MREAFYESIANMYRKAGYCFSRSFGRNILKAGIDRDMIPMNRLSEMDVHFLKRSGNDLARAMEKYKNWLDIKIEIVDQTEVTNI